jgi:hypothetical protein
MLDPTSPAENGNPPEASRQAPEADASLEQRVRRLEDAVAQLQDTRQVEDRIVERLAQRRTETAVRDSAGMFLDAGKQLLPVAAGMIRSETRTAEAQARGTAPQVRRSWLLFDLLAEARSMVRMFVDPRYRMTWPGRLVLPVLGVLLLVTLWELGSLSDLSFVKLIMAILEKLADLLLAFVAYKVLAREVSRYREQIPDAPLPPPRA